ncbi:MAG TPA: phosphatase PAP2 family protein [Dehalococcoidia bacterium]|nr:phosphatase PAP2 family protein [Dehalococcoidia bacterium]
MRVRQGNDRPRSSLSILQFPWLLAGRRNWKGLARSLAICIPAYALFFSVNIAHGTFRSFADNMAPFKPVDISRLDTALFGQMPSVWMQDLVGATGLFAEAAFLYWTTFFWIPTILIGVVAIGRGRSFLLRLILLHAAVVFTADVLYAIVPSRPPWMDADLVRIVAAQSQDGVHLDRNPFAALPSLHVAVPLAFALWFWGLEKTDALRRLAPALALWSVGMAWSVIYTGEHYVVDVIAGYAWAVLVFAILARLGLVHARRHDVVEVAPGAAPADLGMLAPRTIPAAASDQAA